MKLPVDKRAESVDLLTHPAAHATYDRVDLVAFDAAWLLWAASRNCGLRRCFVHEQKKKIFKKFRNSGKGKLSDVWYSLYRQNSTTQVQYKSITDLCPKLKR